MVRLVILDAIASIMTSLLCHVLILISAAAFNFMPANSNIAPRQNNYARTLQWRHNEHNGVSNHQPHGFTQTFIQAQIKRKHQSSASLAFVRVIHRWTPHTKGQQREKYLHLMTSSCVFQNSLWLYLIIINSGHGLSPISPQATTWTRAELLSLEQPGTDFIYASIEIQNFSFKKIHSKMSSANSGHFVPVSVTYSGKIRSIVLHKITRA